MSELTSLFRWRQRIFAHTSCLDFDCWHSIDSKSITGIVCRAANTSDAASRLLLQRVVAAANRTSLRMADRSYGTGNLLSQLDGEANRLAEVSQYLRSARKTRLFWRDSDGHYESITRRPTQKGGDFAEEERERQNQD